MDVIGTGNTLGMDSLAVRAFTGRGRFGAWRTARFPAEYVEDGERLATWPERQPLEFLDRLQDPTDELFVGAITYATEYLLDPQSREDTLFQSQWMQYGRAPAWEDLRFVTVGVDPAASSKTSADYSACVWTGLDAAGDVWVKRVWRKRTTGQGLIDAIDADAEAIGRMSITVAFEAVGGFIWGVQMLRDKGLPTRPISPTTDKVSRAMPVSVLFEGHRIRIDDNLRDSEFIRELLSFPTSAHDDMVDALVHAVRVCTADGARLRR